MTPQTLKTLSVQALIEAGACKEGLDWITPIIEAGDLVEVQRRLVTEHWDYCLWCQDHGFDYDSLLAFPLIIREGETLDTLPEGQVCVLKGGTIRNLKGGTVNNFCEGTVNNFWDGTVNYFNGGTIHNFNGGTVNDFKGGMVNFLNGGMVHNFKGGTVNYFCEGTVNIFWGGTVSIFWGGTVNYFSGGTVNNFNGGTVKEPKGTGVLIVCSGTFDAKSASEGCVVIDRRKSRDRPDVYLGGKRLVEVHAE